MGRRGVYIKIEGPDGCGKSTQADFLVRYLQQRGHAALLSAHPTKDTPIGRLLRGALAGDGLIHDERTLPLLFAADRQEHGTWVRHQLEAGRHVVGDRSALSTWAYALGAARARRDPHADAVGRWADLLSDFAVPPSLIVVLDVPFEVCRTRIDERAGARALLETEELQRQVHTIYRDEVGGSRLGRFCVHVSGTGSIIEVAQRIVNVATAHIEQRAEKARA